MEECEASAKIAKVFDELYPGRCGRIARSELLRFLSLATRGDVTEESLGRLVDAADRDHSGLLDLPEFLAWLFGQSKPHLAFSEEPARLDGPGAALGSFGVGIVYLAMVRSEVEVPHVDQTPERCEPAFGDTLERFRERHAGNKPLQARLWNKVKVCPSCKKHCAFTVRSCNGCGVLLEEVPLSYTDNIFMGFIHGVARGKFPFTVSMRAQTPELLCFDDPLALSPLHFCSIPTAVYVSDLRFLFADPRRGLELVERLFAISAGAALEQFWGNEAFRQKVLMGHPKPETIQELSEIAFCGMNFPPSMYQLHLQFIHPPLLPYHYCLALQEVHFHHGRFFPLAYLRAALALGDRVRMEVHEDSDIRDIVRRVADLGVSYDEAHASMMRRLHRMQKRFSTWVERDFSHQVIDGQVFSMDGATPTPAPNEDPKVLHQEDTHLLQNYGRPYDAAMKPTGTYYRFAKGPGDVSSFP